MKIINQIKHQFFKPNSSFDFGYFSFQAGIFLLASAPFFSILFFLISLLRSKSFKAKAYLKDPWNYPFLLSGILMLISVIKLSNINENSINYVHDPFLSILGLFNWIPFFWIFWGLQIYLNTKEKRIKTIFLLISGSIPIIFTGLGQYFFKWYGPFEILNGLIIWFQRPLNSDMGLTGLFNNQNYAACWLVVVFPFTLVFLLKSKEVKIKRVFSLIIFILFTLTTILTTSRNAFLGLAISSAILIRKRFLVIVIFFLAAILITNHEIFLNQLQNLNFENLKAEERFEFWEQAFKLISERKLFGWGASSFPNVLYLKNGFSQSQHTHNLLLDIAFSYGIPISLLLNTSIYYLIYQSLFTLNTKKNEEELHDKAWISSIICYLSFHFFDLTYFDVRINLIFWILLAGIRNIIKEKKEI